MELFEFNMQDLYDLSNTEIDQYKGYAPSINRQVTKDFIDNYTVSYNENSYYNTGILEFEVRGNRNLIYGYKDGYPMFNPKNRLRDESIHTVRIKPKTELTNIDDLNNVDVDIFCDCNDFRYVFMDKAYKGFVGMAGSLQKYGLVPITSYSRSLIRYLDKFSNFSGREDAPVRNPNNKGALCKHLLLVIDKLIVNPDITLLEQIQANIEDRVSTEVFTLDIDNNDNLQFDKRFYDSNGKLKHKSKIIQLRNSKIKQLENIIIDAMYGTTTFTFKGSLVDNIEDFKTNLIQNLVEYDSYYIEKASLENKNVNEYLPDDFEKDYALLAMKVDELAANLDFKEFEKDVDSIMVMDTQFDDETLDKIDRYVNDISDEDDNIDDILYGEDDFGNIFEGKYIKNFNNFKNSKIL
jgi:hypothetical protein